MKSSEQHCSVTTTHTQPCTRVCTGHLICDQAIHVRSYCYFLAATMPKIHRLNTYIKWDRKYCIDEVQRRGIVVPPAPTEYQLRLLLQRNDDKKTEAKKPEHEQCECCGELRGSCAISTVAEALASWRSQFKNDLVR